MASQTPAVERACLFPRFQQLAVFAGQHPRLGFADVLEAFAAEASLHPHYFFANVQAMHELALLLQHLPLSLAERCVTQRGLAVCQPYRLLSVNALCQPQLQIEGP